MKIATKYKHYKLLIVAPFEPMSPREWDNIGTMVCWHKRYDLGDEQPKNTPTEWMTFRANEAQHWPFDRTFEERYDRLYRRYGWLGDREDEGKLERLHTQLKAQQQAALEKHYVMLPLYLYDHSGLVMNTSGYSCPWDSGQVGWVYCSRAKLEEEQLGDRTDDQVKELLRGEVALYSSYLSNEVYNFRVMAWNDDEDEAVEVARDDADYYGMDPKTNGMAAELAEEYREAALANVDFRYE